MRHSSIGREQLRLDTWLRVDLDEEAERLTVTSRRNRVVIRRFLDPASRLEIAEQPPCARHATTTSGSSGSGYLKESWPDWLQQ